MVKIEKFNIDELLRFIDSNYVAIPEFQRGYVWKEKQVKDLFDSLIKQYPIGMVILWKTTQAIEGRNLFNKKNMKKRKPKYLVIDGQQRLLTLFYLCRQSDFLHVKDLFEEVCENKQKHIIEFQDFYFSKGNRPKLFRDPINKGFSYNRFRSLLGNQYKFPVMIIDVPNYSRAIELFERINQAGTRIATESIFLSESWNRSTNLGRIIRQSKKENDDPLASRIENIIFIHCLAIIVQLERFYDGVGTDFIDISQKQLKRIAEKIKDENNNRIEKELKMTIKSVFLGISFIRTHFKITKTKDLPSQMIITMLGVFFYYCKNPSNRQITEIKKWFWRAMLSSRYVGATYTENVGHDPFIIQEIAKHPRKKINKRIKKAELEPSDLIDTDMHAGRSSLKNAVKILLWSKKPIWINGEEWNPEEMASENKKKEDDHFYPYDLSRKKIVDPSMINSVVNLIYISKKENSRKSKQTPSLWLEKCKSEIDASDQAVDDFMHRQFLQFSDLSKLKRFDKGFLTTKGAIRKNKFKEYFYSFLETRAALFIKEFDRLQKYGS